jgi:hypothetical protein
MFSHCADCPVTEVSDAYTPRLRSVFRWCTGSHSGILRAAFLRFLVPLLFCVALSVAARATTPVVVVISPGNNSQVSSPVHYVASATSSQCSKGIAAIRIYLAPHVSAFTVRSDSLDTNLTLSPGHYQTVVEAWDNCGVIGFSISTSTGDLTVLPGSPFSTLPGLVQDLIVTP